MNDKEIRDEENLARLIRAVFNRAARPDTSARERVLRHLKGEWRLSMGLPPASKKNRSQATKRVSKCPAPELIKSKRHTKGTHL